MIYAPILITTLDRYDCLKKCIEALGRNTWADKTDIYISVDYPPSAHYEKGYQKIKEYLAYPIKEFKSCNFFFQKENLGASENMEWLIKKITEKYDRYVFLEDDMEVAPSFIEFCNKGLEIFKNDNSVVAINASDYVWCGGGYTPPVRDVNTGECNVEKRQLLFHGAAFWTQKTAWVENYWKNSSRIYKVKNIISIYKKSRTFFYVYINKVLLQRDTLPWHKNRLVMIDMMWDYYMMINDKYVVNPIVPLLRDLGVDGNGVNFTEKFSNSMELKSREISLKKGFDYENLDMIQLNANEFILHDEYERISALDKIKLITKLCILLLNKRKRI